MKFLGHPNMYSGRNSLATDVPTTYFGVRGLAASCCTLCAICHTQNEKKAMITSSANSLSWYTRNTPASRAT